MAVYFYVLDADQFHGRIRPALAAARTNRSFEPCRPLCERLLPEAAAFAERYCGGTQELLLARIVEGLPYDRGLWNLLVGEVLLYGAAELPEIQTDPETLCCLLDPAAYGEQNPGRERLVPIQQAHFGARDLAFGGRFYRPDQVGYNDATAVARLADYLGQIDPGRWTTADLAPLRHAQTDEDRLEELAFAREWFPSLRDLYRGSADRGQVLICEVL